MLGFIGGLLCLTSACTSPTDDASTMPPPPALPTLETHADSVAMQVYEAMGGATAWAAAPLLRFDFAFGNAENRRIISKHLWHRHSGDYRVEWVEGADSVYTVLFNVNTRDGDAYLNGTAVDSTVTAALLDRAYRRYINDTYWFLMPIKLLDPGVNRQHVPDSSDATTDVIRLTFGEVGLTPGDQYWVYVDKETGRVKKWAYVLERNPDAPPRYWEWTGYESHTTPAGEVWVATAKVAGETTLFTDAVAMPVEAPEGAFTNPNPIL